jgi:hypothetical protein
MLTAFKFPINFQDDSERLEKFPLPFVCLGKSSGNAHAHLFPTENYSNEAFFKVSINSTKIKNSYTRV